MRKLLLFGGWALALLGPVPAYAQHGGPMGAAFDSTAKDSVLFLDVVTRRVSARNPDIETARHALDLARLMPKVESVRERPMLDFALAPSSIGDPDVNTGYRFSVTQRFPLSRPNVVAAEREAVAQQASYISVRSEVLRMTRQAYWDYVTAIASRRVITEMQQLVEDLRRVALTRYAAGLVGEADALMAETEVAMLDHDAVVADQQRELAAATLNALLQRDWSAPLPPPPREMPPIYEMPDLQRAVEQAYVSRPEIAAASARARADEARARAVGTSPPMLGLMAGYDAMWAEQPMRFQVGASISLPLFGRSSALTKVAEATAGQSRSAIEAAGARASLQVQTAFFKLHESRHEAQIARDTQQPIAQRALGAARAGYETGKNDFAALLHAEHAVTEARLMELRALGAYHNARAELEWAVGADLQWTPEGGRR